MTAFSSFHSQSNHWITCRETTFFYLPFSISTLNKFKFSTYDTKQNDINVIIKKMIEIILIPKDIRNTEQEIHWKYNSDG